MTQQQKIDIIKFHKDDAIAALNSYLDCLYNMTDSFLENGELKAGLNYEEKIVNFVKSLRDDIVKYESIRKKLIANDLNLSLVEIARVGLSFTFIRERFKKQAENLNKSIELLEPIITDIMEGDTQLVDFSQEK